MTPLEARRPDFSWIVAPPGGLDGTRCVAIVG